MKNSLLSSTWQMRCTPQPRKSRGALQSGSSSTGSVIAVTHRLGLKPFTQLKIQVNELFRSHAGVKSSFCDSRGRLLEKDVGRVCGGYETGKSMRVGAKEPRCICP